MNPNNSFNLHSVAPDIGIPSDIGEDVSRPGGQDDFPSLPAPALIILNDETLYPTLSCLSDAADIGIVHEVDVRRIPILQLHDYVLPIELGGHMVEPGNVVHVMRGGVTVRLSGGGEDEDRSKLSTGGDCGRETGWAGTDDENVEDLGGHHRREGGLGRCDGSMFK